VRLEGDLRAVGRPRRIAFGFRRGRQLADLARRQVDDEEVGGLPADL
jgi:hypothetical protein